MNNQVITNILFGPWRPKPHYPTYPPYCDGEYLEDRFFREFSWRNVQLPRTYIPVAWTTCYVDNNRRDLQRQLDTLSPLAKYFTVSQHDDAVMERLPPDTVVFSAGGNRGDIPIPLICSPIPDNVKGDLNVEKDIFCSFVGSMTHPVRHQLVNRFQSDPEFKFVTKGWGPSPTTDELATFVDITKRSKFALAPRGYGKTSFRLYEVMQLNTVPVYVSDEHWLPWTDVLDWNEFAVIVKAEEIEHLDMKLKNISDDRYQQMLDNLKEVWPKYFSMNALFGQICVRVHQLP